MWEFFIFLLVPVSNRSVLVLDTCFWLLQIQKIRPDDITNLLRAKNSLFNKFIEIGNLREAALIANAILLSISQETSMDLQKKYKVLFESNLLIKKFKKILHSDRVRKANSLPRAKHTKKEQSICMNKIMIIIKINFRRTDKYNALNRWIDFCEKWSCVKYLMFFQRENRLFHVRCWLSIILACWACEQTISSSVLTSE